MPTGFPIRMSTSRSTAPRGLATITVRAPQAPEPASLEAAHSLGDKFWPLAVARELEDAILHLRANEAEIGVVLLRTEGNALSVLDYDAFVSQYDSDWLMREIRHYLKRTLKAHRHHAEELSSRLIEPGSCFAGTLAELAFAADRSLHADRHPRRRQPQAGRDHAQPCQFRALSDGQRPVAAANAFPRRAGRRSRPRRAKSAFLSRRRRPTVSALVTTAYESFDWDDEVRVFLEDRTSFSPDALTGMEANLRFAGPETMETKIFGRLTAWQNWIFQRPNAIGEQGALKLLRHRGVSPSIRKRKGDVMNIAAVDYDGQIPNNVGLSEDRARAQARAGKAGIRATSAGGTTWARKASRNRWSICAPRSASIRKAGPSSIMSRMPEYRWGVLLAPARGRPQGAVRPATRASRPGRKCRANIARCCAA